MGKVNGVRFVQSLFVYSSILGVMCFASCSDQEDLEQAGKTGNSSYEVSLNATIGNSAVAPYNNKAVTRVGVAENETHGLKTTWESDDKLTVAYKSGSTLKTTELTVASMNGNSATFRGSVESSADAQAFKTSTLYVVNNKSTDKIDASVENNKLKVSVDLSGQNGNAGKIADYDLLYATGKASSALHFTHQMSVMRLDFTTDATASLGSSVSDLSLVYIPSASTANSIFAKSASFEFGGEGTTSTYDGITFFTLSGLSIPVSDNKAKAYAVIPANDKLTGELSISVKGASGNQFHRDINLKGKSFPAQEVVAKTIGLKASQRVPNIGDYLYSDGSWGPLKYYSDKYPVAVIFSNYTSATDRQHGYTHGYAMALRDAAWPTPWCPAEEQNDYPETENVFEHVSATAPLSMMKNLDGLTTCQTLNSKYLKEYNYDNYLHHYSTKRAAIPHAMEYGDANWKEAYNEQTLVPVPSGTSGWYLPSIGQWFLMLANLSGLNPNNLVMSKDSGGNVYSFSWLFSSATEKKAYLKKFQNYFDDQSNSILGQYHNDGRIPGVTFYVPADGQIDWYLWACDEAKSGYACCVRLLNSEIGFTYIGKTSGQNSANGYAARSVIAF